MVLKEILEELRCIRTELRRMRSEVAAIQHIANIPVQLDARTIARINQETYQKEMQRNYRT